MSIPKLSESVLDEEKVFNLHPNDAVEIRVRVPGNEFALTFLPNSEVIVHRADGELLMLVKKP